MKTLGLISSKVLGFAGFLMLFAGLLLFALGTQKASAQGTAPAPTFSCFQSCSCIYPNTGWCDTNANACGPAIGGCACNTFAGCDVGTPFWPDPY